MKVFICGSLTIGSQLYTQCLRDIQRLTTSAKSKGDHIQFYLDESSAGMVAQKLVRGSGFSPVVMASQLSIPQAELILIYSETEDDYSHEDRVEDLRNDESEVMVRRMPLGEDQRGVTPPDAEPYAFFKKATNLIKNRIHPIPTKGPQIWREIELRPNGGRPWFDI